MAYWLSVPNFYFPEKITTTYVLYASVLNQIVDGEGPETLTVMSVSQLAREWIIESGTLRG